MSSELSVSEYFGGIDIYLFDQIQKGRFEGRNSVLDVGCGEGRNLVWFLRQGHDVFGVDQMTGVLNRTRKMAMSFSPTLPADHFFAGELRDANFTEESMDAVISCAVMHFARTQEAFEKSLGDMWRMLKPNGLLFVRLASDIGIEDQIKFIEGRRAQVPDGSQRYLVNEEILLKYTRQLGGQLLEPLKTTNVQGLRCMTTWCLIKSPSDD